MFKESLNFRDLGGLETNDSRKVKSGLFYRGAGLNFFDEEELERFRDLDIKVIMDLRSKNEIETYPDPQFDEIKRIEHNGLVVEGHEDIDWSPAGMRKIGGQAFEQLNRIESYYRQIAFNNTAFRIMMNEVINDNLPIYFHCATGKDRTGVAAMILEMMLNVKEDEIRKDYLLSNEYRKDILKEELAKVESESVDHPELKKLITLQQGVLEDVFDIVMNSIKERYKSIDDYLYDQFDLSESALNDFRNKYTL